MKGMRNVVRRGLELNANLASLIFRAPKGTPAIKRPRRDTPLNNFVPRVCVITEATRRFLTAEKMRQKINEEADERDTSFTCNTVFELEKEFEPEKPGYDEYRSFKAWRYSIARANERRKQRRFINTPNIRLMSRIIAAQIRAAI